MESSAKTNINVQDIFFQMTERILEKNQLF
jgi:hypothetical protein